MRTFVASLIVLLFCLPSIALAGWEKVENEKADEVILNGKILNKQVSDGGVFYFSIKYKGKLWWCWHYEYERYCYGGTD